MSSSGGDGSRGVSGGGHHQVFPSLTAMNYTSWCIRAQAIMEDHGWWEVVELSEGTSIEKQSEMVAGKDRKLRSHLL